MDAVEEIKARIPVEDLVGRYVDLKRSGASLKGLCPFHGEKTPSFYVSPARGSYHCFGCGRGGDIFSFLMELERLPFRDVLERLAEQAAVQLPERGRQQSSLKGQLYAINDTAAAFFRRCLLSDAGQAGRAYLQERGFDEEAAEMFELGYAPPRGDALVQHLREAGVENNLALAAGLVLQDDKSGAWRDRFRGRLMFPIRDLSGRIVGFGGRTLGDAQPKYLNSPQTEIFDKSAVLFGVHRATEAMRSTKQAVLVEGYLDAIRAHRAGFASTVASLGTAVTPAQLTTLSRLAPKVVIALDPDPAGQGAAARAALTALAEVTRARGREAGESGAVDLRVARLPEGLGDPDELIRDHPDRWESLIAEAIPAFDFYFAQTLSSIDRSADNWRQVAVDRLLPVIQQFADATAWQATWLERLGRETGLDPRTLQRALPATTGRRGTGRTAARPAPAPAVQTVTAQGLTANPVLGVEEALLSLLLKMVVVPAEAREELELVKLSRPEDDYLREAILAWSENGNYDYQLFRETLPEDLRATADELQARDTPLPPEARMSAGVSVFIARLRRLRVQEQLTRANQAVAEIAPEDWLVARSEIARLTQEQRDLDERLNLLSKLLMQSVTLSGD